MFAQSRHPDGYFRDPASCAYFHPESQPYFALKSQSRPSKQSKSWTSKNLLEILVTEERRKRPTTLVVCIMTINEPIKSQCV